MNEDNISKVCRICLEKTYECFEVLNSLTIKMLEILPIQVETSLSRNPVICSSCSENLLKAFEFKMTCLSQNDYLMTFLIGITKIVNLREIITKTHISRDVIKEEGDDICRFCLKYNLTEYLTFLNSTQDSFLKDMIDRCFPEIDVSVSLDPLACNDCMESLQHQFNFVAQCCDSEQLVMNYMSFENVPPDEEINLHNVHDYTMKTRYDFENSLYFIKEEKEHAGTIEESESDDEFLEETGSRACKVENKMHIKTESAYKSCDFSPRPGPNNKSTVNYSCKHCPYKTFRRDSLVSHLLVHKTSGQIKTHKCGMCNFESKWRTSLTAHLLLHKRLTDLTMYKCNDCGYQSKYKKHLRRHIRNLVCKSVFFCQFCKCRSRYQRYIDKHKCKYDRFDEDVKIEPEEVKTAAEECAVNYPTEDAAFTKMMQPTNGCWWYQCNHCHYETKRCSHMRDHVVKHLRKDEVKLHECEVCDFKTKYRASLSHHKKHIHRKKGVVV